MNDFWWWQSVGNLKARTLPLLDEAHQRADAVLVATEPYEVAEALDALVQLLDHPRAASTLLAACHPHAEVRSAALDVHRDLLRFLSERLSDPALFQVVRVAADASSEEGLAALYQVFLEIGRLHGADRTQDERASLRELRTIISRTSAIYRRHLGQVGARVPISADSELDGMEEGWREAHMSSHEGQRCISLTAGVTASVLERCQVPSTRRRVWEATNAHGWPDNGPVLVQLLEARQAAAEALGLTDWANLEVRHTMAGDVPSIRGFLRRVESVARSAAEREREALLGAHSEDALPPWSLTWARAQQHPPAPGSNTATPTQVIATLRGLFQRALGWRIRVVEGASIWAREIVVWEISDAERCLGRVFLDLAARTGKGSAPKTMRIRTGCAPSVLAEVALIASLAAEQPMSHTAIVGLFHEVGHVVHHLCASRSRWVALNGPPQGRDVAELAAHVFEHWAWEPEVLSELGWSSTEVERLRSREVSSRGARVMRQLLYSDYSLSLHQRDAAWADLDAFDSEMFDRYGDGARFAERLYAHFPHLIAYGATYAAYPYSRAVACDVVSYISRRTCAPGALEPFLKEVLAPGALCAPKEGLMRLLGRPWSVQAYLDWIDPAGGTSVLAYS